MQNWKNCWENTVFLIYELLVPNEIQKQIVNKAGAEIKAFEHVKCRLAVKKF